MFIKMPVGMVKDTKKIEHCWALEGSLEAHSATAILLFQIFSFNLLAL